MEAPHHCMPDSGKIVTAILRATLTLLRNTERFHSKWLGYNHDAVRVAHNDISRSNNRAADIHHVIHLHRALAIERFQSTSLHLLHAHFHECMYELNWWRSKSGGKYLGHEVGSQMGRAWTDWGVLQQTHNGTSSTQYIKISSISYRPRLHCGWALLCGGRVRVHGKPVCRHCMCIWVDGQNHRQRVWIFRHASTTGDTWVSVSLSKEVCDFLLLSNINPMHSTTDGTIRDEPSYGSLLQPQKLNVSTNALPWAARRHYQDIFRTTHLKGNIFWRQHPTGFVCSDVWSMSDKSKRNSLPGLISKYSNHISWKCLLASNRSQADTVRDSLVVIKTTRSILLYPVSHRPLDSLVVPLGMLTVYVCLT